MRDDNRWIWTAAVGAALAACVPHEDEPVEPSARTEPAAPRSGQTVADAGPELPPPTEVAPPLPELVPTRPLEHLDLLWYDDPATSHEALWPVGRSAVGMDAADAKALGISGPPVSLGVGLPEAGPDSFAGALLLATEDGKLLGVDPETTGPRWITHTIEDSRLYWRAVGSRVVATHYYGPNYDRLIGWALDTGFPVWERGGKDDDEFDRLRTLWGDGERGYFRSEDAFVAIDLVDGRTLWSKRPAGEDCGMATGDGVAVLETTDGFSILDASTGALRHQVAVEGVSGCSWGGYGLVDEGPVAVADGGLYVTVDDRLRAFDLDDGEARWTKRLSTDSVWADHDAVYAIGDREQLVALDAATGKVRAEISIGVPFGLSIEPVGGAAGPYLVGCDDLGACWILGRREAPVVDERYEIRGTVTHESSESVRGLTIEVDDQGGEDRSSRPLRRQG